MGRRNRSFKQWQKRAVGKGWTCPRNNAFSEEVWIRYWEEMDSYDSGESEARPIPPHRSGGGVKLPYL